MEKFISYLQSKNHSQATQEAYLRYVNLFLEWIDKEPINTTKKDVLKYLQYLKDRKGQQNLTRKHNLIAINHYFTFLYRAEQVAENPCLFLKIRGTKKQTLYKIYSPEELEQLYDSYYQLFVRAYDDSHIPKNQRKQSALSKERNASILSIMLNQGTTTKEIDTIQLNDIDLIKATLKIRGGKKSNERILPLKAEQIGLLMNYIQNLRPKLLEYHTAENEYLFLPLPEYSKQTTDNATLMHVFKPLTKQVKTLDKHFLNFKQVRASIITHWIQTEGLRKAQYKAGHRYISSTENYLPNDLQGLTDDINKLHPF